MDKSFASACLSTRALLAPTRAKAETLAYSEKRTTVKVSTSKGEKFISNCTLPKKGAIFCFLYMHSFYCWKETLHCSQKKPEALVWSRIVHSSCALL